MEPPGHHGHGHGHGHGRNTGHDTPPYDAATDAATHDDAAAATSHVSAAYNTATTRPANGHAGDAKEQYNVPMGNMMRSRFF